MTVRENNSKPFSFLIHTINMCAKCVITTFSFTLKDILAFAEKKRDKQFYRTGSNSNLKINCIHSEKKSTSTF